MKLRSRNRRRQPELTSRQRIIGEPAPKMSSFSYRSRPSTNQASSGRESADNSAKPKSRPRPAYIGLFIARRAGLLIFLIVLVASAINILRLSTMANVRPLDTTSKQNYLQPLQTYDAAADKKLASSILNRNKITIDTAGLSSYMLQEFPELTTVNVTMPLLAHRPLIYVEAAQPALVLNSSNGSFIIGDSGKALSKITSNAAVPDNLPNLTDQSGLQVNTRQQALPSSYVNFLKVIMAELSAKGYKISSFILPATSTELDTHIVGQSYYIKFNLQDGNPAGEAGTFLAVINNLKMHNQTPSQYVDVRVDGRAYYK